MSIEQRVVDIKQGNPEQADPTFNQLSQALETLTTTHDFILVIRRKDKAYNLGGFMSGELGELVTLHEAAKRKILYAAEIGLR